MVPYHIATHATCDMRCICDIVADDSSQYKPPRLVDGTTYTNPIIKRPAVNGKGASGEDSGGPFPSALLLPCTKLRWPR